MPEKSNALWRQLCWLLLALCVACCVAYGVKSWVRPLLPRLANHGLYLAWLLLLWLGMAWALKTLKAGWLTAAWWWGYGLTIAYLIGMEMLSLAQPSWAKPVQSSIAHTAFVFSSPLPFAALLCVAKATDWLGRANK